MDKVLVGIHAPTIQAVYDAFIPVDVKIGDLVKNLARGMADLSDGKYGVSGREMLSLKEPEMLLDPRLTLRDYGVEDGMQLCLL